MQSETLLLRAPELSDVDFLYEWENNSSLWYLSNTLVPISRFSLEQYVLNAQQDIFTAQQLRFMIQLKTGEVVGCIDLFDFDAFNLRAGIGILIDAKYRKMGYASQALDLLIQYAFQKLQLKQLWCSITQNNTESIKLFVQKGFTSCGLRKQWIKREGEWLDENLFQLLNVEKI